MKNSPPLSILALVVSLFVLCATRSLADSIDLSVGTAAQSSQLENYAASFAIDDIPNFTHTLGTDPDPTWQVLLPQSHSFKTITILNRGNCCPQRLRDITVEVLSFSGDVTTDFTGGTVVYFSSLINPANELNGPSSITVDVGDVTGNMIRITRIPDSVGGNDGSVLSMNEVLAEGSDRIISFESSLPRVTAGDPVELSWEVGADLTALSIDNGVGDVLPLTVDGNGSVLLNPGPSADIDYVLTAVNSSGTSTTSVPVKITAKPLIYSFVADNGLVEQGETVNLSWVESSNTTSLTLNGADVSGTSGLAVTVAGQQEFELVATNAEGSASRSIFLNLAVPGEPLIAEFLASNDDGLVDEDGDASDWVEIYNPNDSALSLAGYFLTDDDTDFTKWQFPNVTLGAGERMVVFCSSKDRANPNNELHTNFGLSSGGEYLALVNPNGVTIISEFFPIFPEQTSDVSYGFNFEQGTAGYFPEPTPGSANGETLQGVNGEVAFSVERGFYTSPFSLVMTSSTANVDIHYTLDGSAPTAAEGELYTGPLSIGSTTVVRAIAIQNGYLPSETVTHSYLFKADIAMDSNMDTEITQDAVYGPQIEDALSAVPTISLSFEGEVDYFEKEVSIELINFPDGSFQADAGMERFGGYNTNFDKRSMRVTFRKEYGPGSLEFPVFAGHEYSSFDPAAQFDGIELRAGNHDMSQRGAYLSNRFVDDTMLDMGQISPHGRFVHVYLNGRYWGQYHLRERWNASMLSEYYGGDKDDYDAINANDGFGQDLRAYDGTLDFWDEAEALAVGSDPFTNIRSHIDVINEIDFMLMYVTGNCESEFRAAGSQGLAVPFKFFMKDGDGFLRSQSRNVLDDGPLDLMGILRAEGDPDYEALVADRIHQHYFNEGAMSATQNIARLQDRVNETQLSILTECARWGYRSPESWQSYQDNLLFNHFPDWTDTMIDRYIAAGMYPDLVAPSYSQHGGMLDASGEVALEVPNSVSQVYYVYGPEDTDPSDYTHSLDPRLPGGAVNPAAFSLSFEGVQPPSEFVVSGDSWSYLDDGSNQGTAWRGVSFNDSGWPSGPAELGFGDGDEATLIDNNPTTYFRKSDIVIADPSAFVEFTCDYVFDDGIAIYLNGVEIARENLGSAASYDDYATSASADNQAGSVTLSSSLFNAGTNVIAVELHNRSATSSDLSFSLSLRGNVLASTTFSTPLALPESGWLLSRSYNSDTGEWSALNEAYFNVGTIPANASNLVVSELHYNPDGPVTAAELAVSEDGDDFEFIELMNVSTEAIDLEGIAISGGITFTFGSEQVLEPGGRVVLVENQEAFEARYASQLAAISFGSDETGSREYGGKLSNGGEQIVITDADSSVIHDFTYDDALPWPSESDRAGFSLVLKSTALPILDHSLPTSWVASAVMGGNPGQDTDFGFVGDPDADLDGDGFSALLEYAMGSSEGASHDSLLEAGVETFAVGVDALEYLTLTYQRNLHAQNAFTLIPEISSDLEGWLGAPEVVFVSEVDNDDGTATVTYRSATPLGDAPDGKEFIRLRVE